MREKMSVQDNLRLDAENVAAWNAHAGFLIFQINYGESRDISKVTVTFTGES